MRLKSLHILLGIYSDVHACLCCMCFTQISTSASLCPPVPTGFVWTQKALTRVRTALQGTKYHMTGSSVKVSCSSTAHLNELLRNTTCILNSAWKSSGGVSGSWLSSWIWVFFLACRDTPVLQCMSNSLCCFTPDIDECALPTTCPQGTCTNTDGSFTCIICQPGFKVSEDGQQCDGEVFGRVCARMCFCLYSWAQMCSFLLALP